MSRMIFETVDEFKERLMCSPLFGLNDVMYVLVDNNKVFAKYRRNGRRYNELQSREDLENAIMYGTFSHCNIG